MRFAFTLVLLLVAAGKVSMAAEPVVFEGPWHTTNRKLDGVMTCVVTSTGKERWQGRFYGVWQGVPFDYTVAFAGPATDLRGTATIDHAHYDWTGKVSREKFTGTFGGDRYAGYFDLNSTAKKTASTAKKAAR